MHTKQSLRSDLERLGLTPGGTVMIHASLRAVGPVIGGADTLLDAVAAALGPQGSMMMYVGCESPFDTVGRGRMSPEEERFARENCPVFNPAAARSCRAFGALAEIFRTRPGAICSANVGGRMAALGARRHTLMAGHALDYGYGTASPLDGLYDDGKILILGADPDQVTMLHYAEHVAPISGKRTVRYQAPLLRGGERTWVSVEEYDTSTGIRLWPDRFFARIVEAFIAANPGCAGKIGNAPSWLLDARELVDFAVPVMMAQAGRQAA